MGGFVRPPPPPSHGDRLSLLVFKKNILKNLCGGGAKGAEERRRGRKLLRFFFFFLLCVRYIGERGEGWREGEGGKGRRRRPEIGEGRRGRGLRVFFQNALTVFSGVRGVVVA